MALITEKQLLEIDRQSELQPGKLLECLGCGQLIYEERLFKSQDADEFGIYDISSCPHCGETNNFAEA